MTSRHGFNSCLRLGKVGEAIVAAALGSRPDWTIERRSERREEQVDAGWDYIVRHGHHRGGLEVKTDMRAYETRNLALETEHQFADGTHREGWFWLTTAKFVAVLIAPRSAIESVSKRELRAVARFDDARILVLSVDAMRDRMPDWRRRFRSCSAENDGYTSWSLCVPVPTVCGTTGITVADYRTWFRLEAQNGRIIAEAVNAPRQGVLA